MASNTNDDDDALEFAEFGDNTELMRQIWMLLDIDMVRPLVEGGLADPKRSGLQFLVANSVVHEW